MAEIGHNKGPTMERGGSWRRYAWRRSREALLPKLPLEVVRLRVRRARALGIDYKAYASIRAASGHDVIALLFSSNALRLLGHQSTIPAAQAARLGAVQGASRLTLAHRPLDPKAVLAANPTLLEGADHAPGLTNSWSETARQIAGFLSAAKLQSDRVVLVSETALEREWLAAGKLAGYIPAETYFGSSL